MWREGLARSQGWVVAVSRRDVLNGDEHDRVHPPLLHDVFHEPLSIHLEPAASHVPLLLCNLGGESPVRERRHQTLAYTDEMGADLPLPANRRTDVWPLPEPLKVVLSELVKVVVIVVEKGIPTSLAQVSGVLLEQQLRPTGGRGSRLSYTPEATFPQLLSER